MRRTALSLAILSALTAYSVSTAAAPRCVDGEVWHIEAEGLPEGVAVDAPARCSGSEWMITPAQLEKLGMEATKIPAAASGFLPMSAVGVVEVDEAGSSILLKITPALRHETKIDFFGSSSMFIEPSPRLSGGYVNYDFRSVGIGSTHRSTKAGLDANTFVLGDVAVSAQVLVGTASNNSDHRVERLGIAASRTSAKDLTTWRLGDAYSASGDGVAPVRFTGLQYQRDFSAQPGFVTAPTFNFSGSAASKSTVDILIDNQKIRSQTIEAGPLAIANLQSGMGPAGAQIIITDSFGQKQIITAELIGNPTLLKAGLDNFGINAGAMRPNSFHTEGLFASGFYRRGVNDVITAEVNAEKSVKGRTLAAVQHVGASLAVGTVVGNFGLVTRTGSGSLLSATYQTSYRGNGWSTNLGANAMKIAKYETMGAAQLDGRADSSQGAVTRTTNAVRASFQLDRGFSISGFRAAQAGSVTTGVSSSITMHGTFAPTIFMNITKSSGSGSTAGPTAFVGLNIPLGFVGKTDGRIQNLSLGMQRTDSGMSRTMDITSTSIEPTGVSVHARKSDLGIAADADYAGRSFDAGMSSPIAAGAGYTVYARGAVGYSDGHVGPMKTVFGGYAMIDAGAPHVGIVVNNQPAGESGADGTIFVSRLMPYIRSSVSINADTAPANYDVVETIVSTFPRAGVKIAFSGTSAVMLEVPGMTGVVTVKSIDYPITDRGAFIELPAGDYAGTVNGSKIKFTIPAAVAGVVMQKIRIDNQSTPAPRA